MAKEKEKSDLFNYDEDSIKSLDWKEHIRLRPGMYIGKLGDGASPDDGIYVLVKEVMDNCIDEYTMGHGKTVELTIDGKTVTIRDCGGSGVACRCHGRGWRLATGAWPWLPGSGMHRSPCAAPALVGERQLVGWGWRALVCLATDRVRAPH